MLNPMGYIKKIEVIYMLSSKEIREQFINFFKGKGHTFVPSSPVIPNDDPTLLFTNAGMNQFKEVFLGKKVSEIPRAVNSQKCIRAGGKHNDLEEVGRDGYHHTFFEMLGNWSFADYYKREAIQWAWELFTGVWLLPKDKLYASVHHTDQEAYELWKQVTDINPEHIQYFGDKDNFWEMGDTGPCGPCSEIHIDRGEEYCNMKDVEGHVCSVNGDCHRIIELWNLVFIQYNRKENGSLEPLASRYVDTGAGLERVCQIIQKKNSNYDTDLFTPILQKIVDLSGVAYTEETGISHRVIADHIRTLCFALADGGIPSNEGRGYVLRRILRRAARHGRVLGFREPFLYLLVDTVVSIMGHHYHELTTKTAYVRMIIKAEEERFNLTLDKGLARFDEIISVMEGSQISGSDIFQLYDTYGFPPDLTAMLAEEKELTVDMNGFAVEMEQQKKRAREASQFKLKAEDIQWVRLRENEKTEFVGYTEKSVSTDIMEYAINEKDEIVLTLRQTPFYAESGGQVGDKGHIYNDHCEIVIMDVYKDGDRIIHSGKLLNGVIDTAKITAEIDNENRLHIARNHTATHLLHAALRTVLGDHVQQKGSLVNADYLRFDFTHFQALTQDELKRVEKIVNEQIRKCLPVSVVIKDIQSAREEGAMALFGEKYGKDVRVVSMGSFSKELCGGTHLQNTGEIGFIKILMETSSAAGIRRIEAVTGLKAEEYISEIEDKLTKIATMLSVPEARVLPGIEKLQAHEKELLKEVSELKQQLNAGTLDQLLQNQFELGEAKAFCALVDVPTVEDLRQMGEQIKEKLSLHSELAIGVLVANIEQKVSIVVTVSKKYAHYHAGRIVKKLAEIVEGNGGGKPDMAMAGGKAHDKITTLMEQIPTLLREFN